jgi:hypothetical protein
MEFPLQMTMVTQGLHSVMRTAQHPPRLLHQRSHSRARRDMPSPRHPMRNAAHRPSRDTRHGSQQMPRLRIAVQHLRHFPDPTRQPRRRSRQRLRDLRQRSLCHRCHRPCHHRKQLTGGHPHQWQKLFGGFVLAFGFGRQFAQVFHHGVGIDFADGTDFAFALVFIFALVLEFSFELVFAFAQQTAGDIAEGAQPAFALASLVLHLVFQLTLEFVLELVLEFSFEFIFELRQRFQFTFELVCHDDSSCKMWSYLGNL